MDRKGEARDKQVMDRIEQSDIKMKQIKSVKRVITEEDFDRVSEIIEREGEGQQGNRHKDKEGQEEKRRKIQDKSHTDSSNQEITNIQEDNMTKADTNGGSNVHNKDDEMETEQLRQPNENYRRSNMADNILEKYKIINGKLIREVSTNTDSVINKSTLMAYNNVSFARAKLVLEGKENVSTIEYDRYRKPNQWPNLYQRNTESSIEKETRTDNSYNKMSQGRSYSSALMANKNKDKSEAHENISYIQEKRNAPPVSRIKTILNRNSEYYKQFNTREEDITRERRGLILRNKINDPHEYSVSDRSAKDSVLRESGFSTLESFIRDNIIEVMQHLTNILGKDDRTKGEAMEAIISVMSNDKDILEDTRNVPVSQGESRYPRKRVEGNRNYFDQSNKICQDIKSKFWRQAQGPEEERYRI